MTDVTLQLRAIDKLDVLFAIDNSPSMGDKQDLLADAIPTFFGRLLNPDCVDSQGTHVAGDNGGGDKQCTSIAGTKPEFPPVRDLHVAIVSSSLGGGGGDVCASAGGDPTHLDDEGHLLNRPPVANAKPLDGNGGDFLAWLPLSDPKYAGKQPPNVTPYSDGQATSFASDFQSLVLGVGETGCGLEAQLESWYRFLIQPDPYASLVGGNGSAVTYQGVDATLLKMRHDFLRPDSVVAIVQITDEEDSWSDPRWLGGFGWVARTSTFPGGPGSGVGPRGTSECDQPIDPNNPTASGPNNPDCTSCAFANSDKPISGTPIGEDPNCKSCPPGATNCVQKGWYVPASIGTPITAVDGLNVRYGEQYMKARYGLDPQYDVQRYVDGLTKTQVPDRDHEDDNGAASVVGKYAPLRNCTNPLFAESLPDGSDTSSGALCNLKLGARTPDMVFYALLGGVPNSLVPSGAPSAGDWQKILGHDPAHYDLAGIDPHMIESLAPRPGLAGAGAAYNLGSDPDNGREWNTLTSPGLTDLELACTFDLPQPRDCSGGTSSCDCAGQNGATTAPDAAPLCDPANRSTQIKGKAYPTVRELRVANGLGGNAVIASLCAKNTSNAAYPTYGYRPAMNAVVDRIATALTGQCFPTALARKADGTVNCQILVAYPNQTNQASGCTDPGMMQPAPDVVARFDTRVTSGPAPVVCVFDQLGPGVGYPGATCAGAPNVGWCYVEGAGAGGCAQSIQFGGSGPPAGTTLTLECSQ